MIKLDSIPGYKGRVYYLLKFGRHRPYLESLCHGHIYMDRFRTYVEQEKKERTKGQRDSFEASLVVQTINGKLFNHETDEVIFEFGPSRMVLTPSDFLDRPVFCTMALDSSMLEVIDEGDDYYKTRVVFSNDQKENLPSTFGEYVAVLEYPIFSIG